MTLLLRQIGNNDDDGDENNDDIDDDDALRVRTCDMERILGVSLSKPRLCSPLLAVSWELWPGIWRHENLLVCEPKKRFHLTLLNIALHCST